MTCGLFGQLVKVNSLERQIAFELDNAQIKYEKQMTHQFGRPDFLVNQGTCAVFVHGCFWHGHTCKDWEISFLWKSKINAIIARDAEVRSYYARSRIKYFRVWECELRVIGASNIVSKLARFIGHH